MTGRTCVCTVETITITCQDTLSSAGLSSGPLVASRPLLREGNKNTLQVAPPTGPVKSNQQVPTFVDSDRAQVPKVGAGRLSSKTCPLVKQRNRRVGRSR